MAGQGELVGDATADLRRVDVLGPLLLHLRLGEPDALGHQQPSGGGLQALEAGDPVDPVRVRHLRDFQVGTGVHPVGEPGQHVLQPRARGVVRNDGLRDFDEGDGHVRNATEGH